MSSRAFTTHLTYHFARRETASQTTVEVAGPPNVEVQVVLEAADPPHDASVGNGEVLAASTTDLAGKTVLTVEGLAPATRLSVMLTGKGETSASTLHVPEVPFAVDRLLASSTGAPFDRFGFGGRLDFTGPFLRFSASTVTCAFAQVRIHNRTSDERYWVEATSDGDVTIELSDVFPGDILDITATDFAGHPASQAALGVSVPATAVPSAALADALAGQAAAEIEAALRAEPNAANRHVVEERLKVSPDGALQAVLEELFADANQVVLHLAARPSS